ncbi:hypothetical protein [Actinokineospora fastidiosa]|uniref:HEPN domain-containing protein n=1 Tax=Actinokineospora fastidiosa TaxID=1816 RepID=A0A918LFX5_9PSEU|nr:hypothetical protein [Actinokineospora fastidiosa]GGS43253.1 hypothetical protein GCM10010171_42940 [Actinokineospora fastidiosa]
MRTTPCDARMRQGRRRKAEQFYAAASLIADLADQHDDIADAYVTLCVHAGIAAADVLCCAALGEHAQGESHNDAVSLLSKVDREASRHLGALLRLKTKSGYGHTPATPDEFKRAGRAAESLIDKARRTQTSM